MKKLICALIFLLLTASTAYAETIAIGSANGCLWHLSDTGVVTFYGEGCAIRSTDSLWDYIDEIKEIVIEDGVTGICDYAFEYYPNLRKVTIPGSVKNIGEGAFKDITGRC